MTTDEVPKLLVNLEEILRDLRSKMNAHFKLIGVVVRNGETEAANALLTAEQRIAAFRNKYPYLRR